MNTCKICQGRFDASHFPRVKNGRGVFYTSSACKSCWNTRKKAYREEAKIAKVEHMVMSITRNRPCDVCYRLDRCKTDAFMCAAFKQWVAEGQFTPAYLGMRERVAV